jgi:hypothetical protein
MTVTEIPFKPHSDSAALLAILSDGQWHSTAGIKRHRDMTVNSRISDLRAAGYEIVHEQIRGRPGRRAHRYRLLNPPQGLFVETNLVDQAEARLEYELLWPRNEEHRFRIYRLADEEPVCIATAPDESSVGLAIVTIAREGQFANCNFGLLDTHGTDEKPGEWLIKPWDQR